MTEFDDACSVITLYRKTFFSTRNGNIAAENPRICLGSSTGRHCRRRGSGVRVMHRKSGIAALKGSVIRFAELEVPYFSLTKRLS